MSGILEEETLLPSVVDVLFLSLASTVNLSPFVVPLVVFVSDKVGLTVVLGLDDLVVTLAATSAC